MSLTEAEIKAIKNSITTITLEDVLQVLKTRKIKIVNPVLLANGYKVGYSVSTLRPDLYEHHISISNSKGETDPAYAECIARDLLGEGYIDIGPMNLRNVLHFSKFVKKDVECG